MAAMRYYKREYFNTMQPTLDNGSRVEFKSVGGVWGYFATDNEAIQREFEQWAREKRGGVVEITAEEFVADYVQKKTQGQMTLVRPWREQIGQGLKLEGVRLPDRGEGGAEGGDAVAGAGSSVERGALGSVGASPEKPKFQPPVGKRKKGVKREE